MFGWMGKILRIDLTEQTYRIEDLDEELAKEYIGGRGLATKFLYDEIDPAIDAFDPDNKMIFATCPLTGTGAVGSARFVVVTKSPLGTIGNGNAGGYFGPEIKYAGYDMIIIEGNHPIRSTYGSKTKPSSFDLGKTSGERPLMRRKICSRQLMRAGQTIAASLASDLCTRVHATRYAWSTISPASM